jgi:hypothetical protein
MRRTVVSPEKTMTRFRALSLLLGVLGTLILASPARADEVVLWSGERITGRIVDKSTEALVLETASAENLRISWDEIYSLQTDVPQDAMLTREDGAPRIPTAAGTTLVPTGLPQAPGAA